MKCEIVCVDRVLICVTELVLIQLYIQGSRFGLWSRFGLCSLQSVIVAMVTIDALKVPLLGTEVDKVRGGSMRTVPLVCRRNSGCSS